MHHTRASTTNLNRYIYGCVFHILTPCLTNYCTCLQVVLEDIELLGSTEDLALASKLDQSRTVKCEEELTNHRSGGVIHRPMLVPLTNDNDELQAVLLDAGVSMDLVAQVVKISETEAEILFLSQQKCKPPLAEASVVAPESNSQGNELVAAPGNTTLLPQESSNKNNEEREPTSPFDKVLRQYVDQTSRERAMLEEILATKISKLTDEVSLWQPPTTSLTDPVNSNEITLYTFGTFFTQCLLCGGSEIQVTCVQMVERTGPLMKKAIGAIFAFEGIIALIVLGIREAKSSQVFQAAIHLAHTVFQTEVTRVNKTTHQPESERSSSKDHESISALGLIEEVSCTNWGYGLRTILEWALASPLCWSISHTGKPNPSSTSSRSLKGLSRFDQVPPSIDRDFLQFIRLLVEQDLTRTKFFDELLDLTPTGNASGIIFARNRLRLLRLALRNEIIRCQISTNVKTNIQALCTSILTPKHFTHSDQTTMERGDRDVLTIRLASECLEEVDSSVLSRDQRNYRANLLTSVRRHLEVSNNSNSHHSHRYFHTAFFIQDPLLDAEVAEFDTQLQRYFSHHPRPTALYRHSFVRGSRSTSKNDKAEMRESFQKGNIAFDGQVVARTLPIGTFHDEIQHKSAPFVFEIGTPTDKKSTTTPSSHHAGHQEIVSSFSAFRGTIERRNDPPKRSNKVSPEQHLQAPSGTKAAGTTTNKQPVTTVVNSTVSTLPSNTTAVQSPSRDAEDSTAIPKSAITNQTFGTTPPASHPPISIPAVAEQVPPNTEGASLSNKANQPDPVKGGAKGRGKEKGKGKTSGKDPEHCVLQ